MIIMIIIITNNISLLYISNNNDEITLFPSSYTDEKNPLLLQVSEKPDVEILSLSVDELDRFFDMAIEEVRKRAKFYINS